MSDPLPLSPETMTSARQSIRDSVRTLSDMYFENALAAGRARHAIDAIEGAASRIEQEARTLARAEVIAEIKERVPEPFKDRVMPLTTSYAQGYRDALTELLSRLGERE